MIPLRAEHLPAVVQVHLDAFPGFFLSFLGPSFLREFYGAFLAEEDAVALVSLKDQGTVTGVIVGTCSPQGFFKRLLARRWWAFCLASTRALLRQPKVAPRLWRAFFYRGEAPRGVGRALLSSLAVSPHCQGNGLGRCLVQRWLESVRSRGVTGCYLTTDADGNESVNRFYSSLGWKLELAYATPEGRRMNRYTYDFS